MALRPIAYSYHLPRLDDTLTATGSATIERQFDENGSERWGAAVVLHLDGSATNADQARALLVPALRALADELETPISAAAVK